jgi:hypothetical protein
MRLKAQIAGRVDILAGRNTSWKPAISFSNAAMNWDLEHVTIVKDIIL